MKTNEFRCERCDKLLAKVLEDKFEAKCPRCGTLNIHKADISYDEKTDTVIISGGSATMVDVLKFLAARDVDIDAINKEIDTEALEALNRVSRHGDNV